MYYKPNNCFFFVSNSSCVITPLSSKSLYFFNSSALLWGISCLFKVSLILLESCLSTSNFYIVLNTSSRLLQSKKLIFPDDVATLTPLNAHIATDEILSIGKSTLLPKAALPYTLLSVTAISHFFHR